MPHTIKKKNRRWAPLKGFILIELLVVSVIISIVSLAIYSSFSAGLRIWKRVNTRIEAEDTALFFERLGAELRQALMLQENGLQGLEDRVEIPAIIKSKRMDRRGAGRLSYVFDPDRRAVRRSVTDYSGMYTGSPVSSSVVLERVRQAQFSFYRYDPESRRFEWTENWQRKSDLPLAVRVEIRREEAPEEETLVRTFSIPAARKAYE